MNFIKYAIIAGAYKGALSLTGGNDNVYTYGGIVMVLIAAWWLYWDIRHWRIERKLKREAQDDGKSNAE